ncbi:hypothetical protein Patl1_14866 [Pistacia atlantica]|uniref:Uncharacterized protein n=1 Tax=Pistacia atlantica TaxID=434234 RepID=A0ACC1AX33_9ROSI|nr:hypothetical protein Patl1_14866 [Pistacia atlantica]
MVHGIVAGAAIAVAIGARAYLENMGKIKIGNHIGSLGHWDELLIELEIIDGIVKALQLQAAPDAVFSIAVTSLKPEDAFDPNQVKCVVDNRGYAIYFSRELIPYN